MAEEMRRRLNAKRPHPLSELPNFPLGTVTAAVAKEILQAAGVHSHDHFGRAGVGQDKTRILNGALFRRPVGCLFLHAGGEQLLFMFILEQAGELLIMGLVLLHRLAIDGRGLGQRLDFGGRT